MTSIVARRELPNQNAIGQTIGHGKAMVGFLLAFGLSLVLSSCGILDTRTPQPPAQTSSTFTPPTSPSMVIDNLINAIGERNTDNYIRCLADSNFSDRKFQFVPTQEALSKYALQFSTWSVSSEREYFENLKSQMPTTATALLFFSSQGFESVQSDSALFTGAYDLTFQHNKSGVPQEAKGTLQFYMATDRNKLWMIYRWVDLKTGNDFTWSELKGVFGT
jgi:hypothetical protein